MKSNKKRKSQTAAKRSPPKNLPREPQAEAPALPFEPGVSPNAVDVTGIVPDDVFIDPEITEGHRGYEESGRSEISQRNLRKD